VGLSLPSCELLSEISHFFRVLDKEDSQLVISTFSDVMMKKKNISSLLLLESPNKHLIRSLSNRLVMLLLGMSDEYKFVKSLDTAKTICSELMKSMICKQ
jgi:hypothetical protein